jgi:hypothetical protein
MAIIKTSGSSVIRTVVGTTMLSIGGQGQPVATTANNNRESGRAVAVSRGAGQNAGFASLDQQINALDARYGLLSNQADWVDYAMDISGDWNLCADCEEEGDGQRLYRQYNMNRLLSGQSVTDTVIGGNVPGSGSNQTMQLTRLGGTGLYVTYSPGGGGAGSYICVQLGRLLANPVVLLYNV